MSDQLDEASVLEEMTRSLAIDAIVNRVTGESEIYCIACDCEIEPARRSAVRGVKRCANCQVIFENKKKHFAR